MLSQIDITIDFNGHGDQTLLFKYSKVSTATLSEFIMVLVVIIPQTVRSDRNVCREKLTFTVNYEVSFEICLRNLGGLNEAFSVEDGRLKN